MSKDKVVIKIDKTNIDKIDIDFDIDKSHNGSSITLIEISPNGKYLVSYSKEDNLIIGWNVEIKNEIPLKLDKKFSLNDKIDEIDKICVSDNKKLVCLYNESIKGIYDMNNNNFQNNKLNRDFDRCSFCIFNMIGELVIYNQTLVNNTFNIDHHIFIYSMKTKNNKWKCKKIYKIPRGLKVIRISKYNKLYLYSDNSIHEYNLITENSRKIFVSDEKIDHKARISNNEMIICIRINNKIIICSNELEIPIVSFDIVNNDTQLCNFIHHTGLIHLLLPLLNGSTIMENYWNEFINRLKEKGQLSKEYQTEGFSYNIRTTIEYAFGILNGNIWKIKLEEILAKMDLTYEIPDETIENWYFDDDLKINKTYDHLNILLLNPYPYINTIHALFQKVTEHKNELEESQNLIKWKINIENGDKIKLQVFKKINISSLWELICKRVENLNLNSDSYIDLLNIKLLNDNNIIIILTNIGLFIYYFNEINESITLNYYYYYTNIYELKRIFSKSTLPLSNYASFKHCDGWVLNVKDDKESLLKHGVVLLKYAVSERNVELIEDIYKKCMNYFKEDPKNNKVFLSIITSTMPLLNIYYPEYISRYSLETTMITDSFYKIEYRNEDLHLYTFLQLQIGSIWYKYEMLMNKLVVNHAYKDRNTIMPTITFMNPYIRFVNYPRDYNWFFELFRPQPSPFVRTINNDIYKTWNGETLINFKWNTYGRYYYSLIWIGFMVLHGCFSAAVTIPPQHINENTRKQLLIAAFILGFIHLIFEVRHYTYNPTKYLLKPWKLFDLFVHFLSTYTPIFLLSTNDRIIEIPTFTCLVLNIKFLLFFRAYEYFGVFFVMIVVVGKRMISLLIILLIITIGYAHAFYILLSPNLDFSLKEPTYNNDTNNPWNLATTYLQVFENGTISPNPFIIQQPDGNTNMFVDFRTALFAMYKFLTGDSGVLSNWQYDNNPSLIIMYILFSFMTVVYLMNLFIGLFTSAFEGLDIRVLYLAQKAEILAEIELFYLLPHQRRWEEWFPEVLYYHADADKTRGKIKELMSKNEWNSDELQEIKKDLLNKLRIQYNPGN
ncbi:hypothetical protein RclHR1_12620005 [Rhizophagus clarus]|uniref:Ion transport domain-containing protein n=1 Tax=Rhizophagus clarus TaxID=94130 RepID=A0A2Z6QZZ6_9GLOM|nr:hypothetical protein RclHR1_12620005 [Rhizophagus clarus]GET00524.1 hypothetical protein GLOIN_2v1874127 [Rhizophagus clarus]